MKTRIFAYFMRYIEMNGYILTKLVKVDPKTLPLCLPFFLVSKFTVSCSPCENHDDIKKMINNFAIIHERLKKKSFSLYKKLFRHTNHHQLLNDYVRYNFFAFYQILIVKSNQFSNILLSLFPYL